MNFAVDGKHRDFFRTQRWIEFEGLLSSAQRELMLKEIDAVLAARLKTSTAHLQKLSMDKIFAAGHDLWRGAAVLKKNILSRSLAEAAAELIEHKPLRFGYDMLLPMTTAAIAAQSTYAALLGQTPALQDICCIQGALCGLMLCLKAEPQPALDEVVPAAAISEDTLSGEVAASTLFSLTAGHGVIFAADVPINFAELTKRQGYVYLMLVYTQAKAVYRMQPDDPHAYDFKQLGYNFGDRLTDNLNPIVYA